jgi:two-component system, NtrC family, response regulator
LAKILIIDDDEGICFTLSSLVKIEGYEANLAHTLKDGLEKTISGSYDVVFLDVFLPDGNGLDILPEILKTASRPEVVILTAEGNMTGAELALRSGAWNYLQKPISIQEIKLLLFRVLQYREARTERKPSMLLNRAGIIGDSPPIKSCLDLVSQAAQSDTSVLITGETGTGKELFAYAIHNNSPRSHSNFIVVDCAALPETLVESVLFGYEKGAFTGADRTQEGLIQQADGGSLFLDEVGELRLSVQGAFLRVLQEHRYRPVGGKREIRSDFRLIAATNRDLDHMVRTGQFRRDLFHRIQSMVIDLPPLRERKRDLRELAMYFMNRYCDRHQKATKGFSPEFIEALAAYDWSGNVRELENTMDSLLSTAGDDPTLFSKHLPLHIRLKMTHDLIKKEEASLPKPTVAQVPSPGLINFKDHRDEVEKKYLEDLMSLTRWDIKKACKLSALSRSRLYALLNKYGITSSSLIVPQ